ncbi:MAG: tRNA (adenosine(37)-N6)-threonylcarbamoyltransferase complex dimerization subunit type 1 TsaB [Clostridiales bacterium]|nr:tRNA (adenosine(37)-N6)-threonylcarbamoyltransferase complex dimerization subunit type 1 TsaB [Clostridiales bacterium]
MKILAVESTSVPASVAVIVDGRVLGEFTLNIANTHSEKLIPLIDNLMAATSLSLRDIDVFAVSIGPGSFTGIRIGMSAVKMMAVTCDKPLIGVSVLDSLAYGVGSFGDIVVPIINARNETVYTSFYEACLVDNGKSRLNELSSAEAIKVDSLCDKIAEHVKNGKRINVCGDGIYAYAEKIQKRLMEYEGVWGNVSFSSERNIMPNAVNIGLIAFDRYMQGNVTYPQDVEPLYVREAQATQKLMNNN